MDNEIAEQKETWRLIKDKIINSENNWNPLEENSDIEKHTFDELWQELENEWNSLQPKTGEIKKALIKWG